MVPVFVVTRGRSAELALRRIRLGLWIQWEIRAWVVAALAIDVYRIPVSIYEERLPWHSVGECAPEQI